MLIERGLVPAIRAMAVDSPLTVTVIGIDGLRLPSPLAAALYFATYELLANVTKHADTSHAEVSIACEADSVVVSVTDTGRGGANLSSGGGLEGVRRQLDVFDAVLDIRSPSGGPTNITVSVPCASF